MNGLIAKIVLVFSLCALVWGSACAASSSPTPEALGVSSSALVRFVDELEAVDHPRDFIVFCKGQRVAVGSWRGVLRGVGQTNEGAINGRTPIGGLTRLLVYAAAGIAVDKGKMKVDERLESLVKRMLKDDADGCLAADELSALVEKSVGESTAAFIVANFMNRLEGTLVHNWTAEAQEVDKRLMKGGDGVAIEIANIGRIADCLLHEGRSGKRQLVPMDWMRRYPLRTLVYGGNVMMLSPEKDTAVVVLTSAKDGKVVVGASEHLMASVSANSLPEDPSSYDALTHKCRSLALPAQQVEKKVKGKVSPTIGERNCILDLKPYGQYKRNSEGDIVALKDGRLMLMWNRMSGSTSDDAHSDICRRYSSDGGKTWTESEVAFTTPKGTLNVMCVSLLRLAGDDLALAYLLKSSEKDCRPLFYTSSDEGRTWKGPVKIIPDGRRDYYVVNNGRLVQLRSGRLVVASSRGRTIEHWLSDDEGKTWRSAGNALVANKPNGLPMRMEEPGTIELKDGRLMTYIRTDADWQYVTYSSDSGETWSPVVASSLRSPRSPASLVRLSDGRIAAVWNDHEMHPENRFLYPYHNGSRAPLTLGFSEDEGRTWKERVDLESTGWNSYPFLREVDGRLIVGYSYGAGLNSLRLVSVGLEPAHSICR